MKEKILCLATAGTLAIMAVTHTVKARTYLWSGVSGTDLLWNTPANWSPAASPGTSDDARFFDPGATNDTVSISSVVSANKTIHSLWLGQTNGIHNILINPGVTLTIAGTNDNGWGPLGSDPNDPGPDPSRFQSTLYVGTKAANSSTQVVTNTISGGGTLVVSNRNNEINVRQFHPTSGAHRALLDLSGLDTFVANLGRIRVGDGEAQPLNRTEGHMLLAKTNTITLTGTNFQDNVQLVVGNNDVNSGGACSLVLGQKNTLSVDQILVGGKKQTGTIRFASSLTAPSFFVRGSDGASRVAAFRIGDQSDQISTGSGNNGTVDLSAGTADILADTISIGKGQNGNLGGASTGTLTLGAGTLDVNTLELGYQTANNAIAAVTGTANFNNPTVVVNKLLRLGRSAGATAARNATLNINGGSVTIASNIITEGTATIRVTNSVLALPAHPAIRVSVIVLDGGTISNAATIRATNSLIIVNNGQILGGNPIFDMGNSSSAPATWDVQGAVGGGLTVSNTFQGSGTYYGNLIQAAGATISPGGNGVVGTLSVQQLATGGNITLNGGVLRFDLSNNGVGGNSDQITATGTLTLNGTNDVNLTALGGAFDTANPYTLITSGTLVGTQDKFRVAGALAQSRYIFTFDTLSTPNQVKLVVSGSGAANLAWAGDGLVNTWDAKGAVNWLNGLLPSQFFSLDNVTFNDSGSALPPVSMVGTLIPGTMTVTNSTKNYAFGGTGGLAASGSLFKTGPGSLTFNNSADNSFSGLVTMSNGVVTFSNTGQNTFANGITVGGGSLVWAGNSTNVIFDPGLGSPTLTLVTGTSLSVSNANANSFGGALIQLDGTLRFNQAVDSALDGDISGSGTLIKGGAGKLTVNGNNSGLSSIVQINGGAIKAGTTTALGGTGAVITNSGTLDLNGRNLGTLPVTASGSGAGGSGAIVNTGGPIPAAAIANGLSSITLAGDTTFGGSGPWDTDPVKNVGLWGIQTGTLSTGGNRYNLTKVGLNQVGLSGATIDDALGDIDVQQGLLAFQGNTTSMGNPSSNIIVRAGATVSFYDTTTAWNKKFVLFGDGVTPSLFNYNGANTIAGAVTLNGNCVFGSAPLARGTPVSLTLNGPIGGTGSLIKPTSDAANNLMLAATNTYTGNTVVDAGTLSLAGEGSIATSSNITIAAGATLDATLRTDGTFKLAGGQTLRGNGAVNGTFIANAGSTVSPGASLGSLSFSNAVTLRGTNFMELDATSGTSDSIIAPAGVSLSNAVIVLTNLSGTLIDGATFQLFSAPPMSGAYTLQPAAPGPGQTWNTSNLLPEGWIRVVGNPSTAPQPRIVSIILSGSNLIISGTNGPASGNYQVLRGTNIAQPLSTWTLLTTNTFNSGNFSFMDTVNPNVPQRFYTIQFPSP